MREARRNPKSSGTTFAPFLATSCPSKVGRRVAESIKGDVVDVRMDIINVRGQARLTY